MDPELLGIAGGALMPRSFQQQVATYPRRKTPQEASAELASMYGDAWEGIKGVGPAAALMGASMIPGVGEGIDAYELGAGLRDKDYSRAAWGGAGLALPFVAAGSLKKLAGSAGNVAEAATPPAQQAGRFFGDDLPMDEASRMARAQEQGYTVDAYHGTKGDFGAFDMSRAGASDPGLVGEAAYFSPGPELASHYAESARYGAGDAPGVLPAKLRLQNPLVINDGLLPDGRSLSALHPAGITRESAGAIREELRGMGHDGVEFRIGGEPAQFAVFDPKNIRSRFARFDPSKADSSDLLAGIAGASLLGANRRRDR